MRAVVVALVAVLALGGCDNVFQLRHLPDVIDAPVTSDAPRDGKSPPGPDGRSAGIQFVQGTWLTSSSTTNVFVTFNAVTQPGCLIVLLVGSTSAVQPLSVSAGTNLFSPVAPIEYLNGVGQTAYYAANCSSVQAIQVQWVDTATGVDLRALEYSGVRASSPLTDHTENAASGNQPSTNALAVQTPGTLLVAGFMVSGSASGPTPGYAERLESGDGNYAEDMIAAAPAAYNAAVTSTGTGGYVAQLLAFTPP